MAPNRYLRDLQDFMIAKETEEDCHDDLKMILFEMDQYYDEKVLKPKDRNNSPIQHSKPKEFSKSNQKPPPI
jgi:hypothetical protein